MQQRVAIAQALMTRPAHPADGRGLQRARPRHAPRHAALVRELWADTGTTILFVTHNIDEALRLGTRVVVLAKEAPDQGSRVAMDLAVPDPCEEDIPIWPGGWRVARRKRHTPRPIPPEQQGHVGYTSVCMSLGRPPQ